MFRVEFSKTYMRAAKKMLRRAMHTKSMNECFANICNADYFLFVSKINNHPDNRAKYLEVLRAIGDIYNARENSTLANMRIYARQAIHMCGTIDFN